MKNIVVISEAKQSMLDRLLANGVKLGEIAGLLGVNYDTLRQKLVRRKRGDANWHNRDPVDHRGAYMKMKARQAEEENEERDDLRIALFDMTKSEKGVSVAEAARKVRLSEAIVRTELEDFCQSKRRSDLEAICRKDGNGRYYAIGWQSKGNHAGKAIEVVKRMTTLLRETGGRCPARKAG